MEPIGEILKRIRTNSTDRSTDTSSSADLSRAGSSELGEAVSSAPDCPICKGARVVHPLLPTGKPDYSKVVPCRCVRAEVESSRQTRLQRYSNLGPLVHLSFGNLLPQGRSDNPANREQFSRAYEAARAFAENPEGCLVLSGPSGCGKTHLAVAIARRCIDSNRPVLYVSVPDLLDHLRSSFGPNSEMPYSELFEQVRNAALLVLDDLGAQSSTPWAKEKLEQLLNHRFGNQLPTVIVSILPLDELDERIRTRLAAADYYELCPFEEKTAGLQTVGWLPQFALQKKMTFETFDWKRDNLPLEQQENLERAFNLAVEFARLPEGWLVFQGDNGCGKTHLAAAIVNYRYQHRQPALFVVAPDFLDHLKSTFSPESKISYDHLFENVKNAPLLVLDDFGRQSTTPWAQEKLYQVINYRYNAQLPMVVTTNSSTDEMDGPIASRFVDPKISTLFHITAPDYWAGRRNRPAGARRRGPGG